MNHVSTMTAAAHAQQQAPSGTKQPYGAIGWRGHLAAMLASVAISAMLLGSVSFGMTAEAAHTTGIASSWLA